MNKKNLKLIFGIGPIYVLICAVFTIIAIIFNTTTILKMGIIPYLNIPFKTIGGIIIICGIALWIYAVIIQKINIEAQKGNLITNGAYSIVRNPVYSAFLLVFTGIILLLNNIILLFLPIIYWLLLTLLLINTEEKWLIAQFGDEYINYCKKVNRTIPWFPKNKIR